MSDLQGRRIPGEEGSGRRRWIWIGLGLLLLLLLAVLIPFACQAIGGGSGQQGDGQGAQGNAQDSGQDDRNGNKTQETAGAQSGAAQNEQAQDDQAQDDGTGNAGAESGGEDAERSGSGEPTDSREGSVTRLSVRDQIGSGAAVTVPAATLEGTRGWLAVRVDDGGKPGRVLGRAPLKAGGNEDVKVELDRPVASSQRLYATVHAEDPADGKFTFPAGDPTATQSGQAASEPISYTVNDAAENGADDATGGGIQAEELPESGGLPPGALLVVGTALLLSSAACLSLVLRRSEI